MKSTKYRKILPRAYFSRQGCQITSYDTSDGMKTVLRYHPAGKQNHSNNISNHLSIRGHYRNEVCVFSLHDLPLMIGPSDLAQGSLFINKFMVKVDSVAAACWSERLLRDEEKMRFLLNSL